MSAPRDGWLVAIDMQRIFAAGPWGSPRFDEIVEPVARLAEAFGERAIFTRFVAPNPPTGSWREYYDAWPFALQSPDSADYQLVDAFDGHRGRTVDATTFGKWDELRARFEPGTRLVVCGTSTECCVITTVLAAADAGMRMQVVADACAGVDARTEADALAVMALFTPQVEIVHAADVLR